MLMVSLSIFLSRFFSLSLSLSRRSHMSLMIKGDVLLSRHPVIVNQTEIKQASEREEAKGEWRQSAGEVKKEVER